MNNTNTNLNPRILIIDDNSAIHEDFRKILGCRKTHGSLAEAKSALFSEEKMDAEPICFELDFAFQGSEGLDKVQRALEEDRPYALAFVDVRMPPGWDGVETISRIWQTCPETQIVICTAYSDYSWDQIASQLGTTDNMVILKKPFDNVEVLQLAHALTKKWMVTRQSNWRVEDLNRMVDQRTKELLSANEKLMHEAFERTQVEEALRRSEQRFATAFRASPISMVIKALEDRRFIDVNDSFLQLTGFTRQELIGHTAAELHLYANPQERAELFEKIENEGSVRNMSSKLRTKSETLRDTLVSAESFALGNLKFVLVITEDVTERLSLESQLRQAQKMEGIGQLAAGVAHDFNNILTVIQGHVGLMLASENLQKDMESSLRQVSTASERAAGLTRQLLAFSRKQLMQPKVLDLNEVVRGLDKMLRRLLGEHIDVKFVYAQDPLRIYADTGNLEQVLINLAVNARDAMPKGGALSVTTAKVEIDADYVKRNSEAKTGTYVRLCVTDTGCGIEPSVLHRIFEPFFTTKGVGKGTGLGLSTVYGIVKQHEGWLEVESQTGHGTSFIVYLPVTDKPLGPPAETIRLTRTSHTATETVLLVEDEVPLREMAEHVLVNQGYHVLHGGSGPEALKVWTQNAGRIDLLLTDMVMPEGLSGSDLAQILTGMKPDLKVIYSSGYSLELTRADFPHSQNFLFLPKPYTPAKLVKTVRDCLDNVTVEA